jgi:hypothetical protein
MGLDQMPRFAIPLHYALTNMVIRGVVSTLVTAVMAVAVWEFYWKISRSSEQA